MHLTHATDDQAYASDGAPNAVHHESATHFFAREAKLVLRWAVFIFGAATILTFMTFFFFAIVPAIALVASLALLMIVSFIEKQTTQPGDPHDETAEDQLRTRETQQSAEVDPEAAKQIRIDDAVERKSARIIIGIVVSVAVIALIIAGVMFGRELFIIGGFIFFAYMLLVATPVWLGWLNDEAEDEVHRIEQRIGESHSQS